MKHQLWSLPKLLATQVLAACVDQRDQQCKDRLQQQLLANRQRQSTDKKQNDIPMYVIDLFSGGESWRTTVEGMGLVYVPIDIASCSGAA